MVWCVCETPAVTPPSFHMPPLTNLQAKQGTPSVLLSTGRGLPTVAKVSSSTVSIPSPWLDTRYSLPLYAATALGLAKPTTSSFVADQFAMSTLIT